MTERLLIQRHDPPVLTIVSITRSGAVATVTTFQPHGYATKDYVTIAGATVAAYNGKVQITVTGTTTFTYAVSGAPATPAAGPLTVVYETDAQGGQRVGWRELATVPAALMPVRADERLQAQAIGSQTDYRFRVRARTDLSPKQRVLWTQRWPPGQPSLTLEIHGVLPWVNDLQYQQLDCGRVA